MSRAAAIRAAVRQALNNRALMLDDVREVEADAQPSEGQVTVFLLDPRVTVSVPAHCDRRGMPVQEDEEAPPAETPSPKVIPRLPPRPTTRRV